jgi:hypothetical protein
MDLTGAQYAADIETALPTSLLALALVLSGCVGKEPLPGSGSEK